MNVCEGYGRPACKRLRNEWAGLGLVAATKEQARVHCLNISTAKGEPKIGM
jgi:hypothetical protein